MFRKSMAVALAALTLAPAVASAAPPEVRTGAVSNRAQNSATLHGQINPHRNRTSYFFQYGTTRLYGAQTAETPLGGSGPHRLSVPISSLAPDTVYHYRLIVKYGDNRVRFGTRETFKTEAQPRGVILAGNPSRVAPGGITTLTGSLTGSGDISARQVILQSNPFPYTQGFQDLGNTLITDAAGAFSFAGIAIPVTTQFRVRLAGREIASPIVGIEAALQVKTEHRQVRKTSRRVTYRFKGSVTPAAPGAEVAVQKYIDNSWRTIYATIARGGGERSTYRKTFRIRRSGQFRIVVNVAGAYGPGVGRAIRLKGR